MRWPSEAPLPTSAGTTMTPSSAAIAPTSPQGTTCSGWMRRVFIGRPCTPVQATAPQAMPSRAAHVQ